MEDECKFEIATKYGHLLIVDQGVNYAEAKSFCEDHLSGQLPSLHNKTIVDDISSHMSDCTATGIHGNRYKVARSSELWRIGLVTEDMAGNWTDGQAYSRDQHQGLFTPGRLWGYYAPDFGCQNGALNPTTEKLHAESCTGKLPFLCLRDGPSANGISSTNESFYGDIDAGGISFGKVGNESIQQVIEADKTPLHGYVTCDDSSSHIIIVVQSVFLAILLLLLSFLFIRKIVRQQKRKNKGRSYKVMEVPLCDVTSAQL